MSPSRRLQEARQRKKSILPGIFLLMFGLGLGASTLYLYLKVQEQKALQEAHRKKPKAESLKARVPAPKIKKVHEVPPGMISSVEESVNSLLVSQDFRQALQMIDQISGQYPKSDEVQQATKRLRGRVNVLATKSFEEEKEATGELVIDNQYEQGIKKLEKAKNYGIESIQEEAEDLIEDLKDTALLDERIQTWANLQNGLAGHLKKFDYPAAEQFIDVEAERTVNDYFRDNLLAFKDDFNAVRDLWAEFLGVMEEKIGKEDIFGIRKGPVTRVNEIAFYMTVNGQEEEFPLSRMQPKWIEIRAKVTSSSPVWQQYATGLLYLHKGRVSEAKKIFTRLDDPLSERQFRWLKWQYELDVSNALMQLKTDSEAGKLEKIGKRRAIAKIRAEFGNSDFLRSLEEFLGELERKVDIALEKREERIQKNLRSFASIIEEARVDFRKWARAKEAQIEEQYRSQLYFPVDFKLGNASVAYKRGDKYREKIEVDGKTYRAGYGFYVVKRRANLHQNLKNLRTIEKNKKSVSMAHKRRINKYIKRMEAQLKSAEYWYNTNRGTLKLRIQSAQRDFKNKEIRYARKLKTGKSLSEDRMRELVNR